MPLLTLGVLAHVDAGKTGLTERLLFDAGVIDALGRVDDGTTRTDAMDLERRRGITIRAAVTSFAIEDLAVTIVDTPGHPDFIAEVERSLTILDAAVLVISAVEGVQPQTVVIWRALRRLGVPTVLFVNKMDRRGADVARVLSQVRDRLTDAVVPLSSASAPGTTDVVVRATPLTDDAALEPVAAGDDALLSAWLGGMPAGADVHASLRAGVAAGRLTPLLCGSAITGAGVEQLRVAIRELLPPARETAGEAAGTVFAIDRTDGVRRAWIRLWFGDIHVRDRLGTASVAARPITRIQVISPQGLVERTARAGEIAAITGWNDARVGDTFGRPPARSHHRFPPAALQALIEPADPRRRTALFTALTELAQEDPLIGLRLDEVAGEATVSLHGEVQKEVLAAVLAERFGVAVRFAPTAQVCIERAVGTGQAVEEIKRHDNPYLATIGLRVDATAVGSGVTFSPGIERGNLPPAFIAATEEGVRAALGQGLFGWEVTDLRVTMTASGYWPRQSKPHQGFDKSISSVGADFRRLAPVVLMAALQRAGTRVCRPVDRCELDVPNRSVPNVTALLGRLGGRIIQVATSRQTLMVAELPSLQTPALAAALPDLTGGEGLLTTQLDHYAPVTHGSPPRRSRRGPDPLDRLTWFRDMPR